MHTRGTSPPKFSSVNDSELVHVFVTHLSPHSTETRLREVRTTHDAVILLDSNIIIYLGKKDHQENGTASSCATNG